MGLGTENDEYNSTPKMVFYAQLKSTTWASEKKMMNITQHQQWLFMLNSKVQHGTRKENNEYNSTPTMLVYAQFKSTTCD
jgi:hypothetical protein